MKVVEVDVKKRKKERQGGAKPIGERINEWIRFHFIKKNYSYKQKEKNKNKIVKVEVKTKGRGGEESNSNWFSNDRTKQIY